MPPLINITRSPALKAKRQKFSLWYMATKITCTGLTEGCFTDETQMAIDAIQKKIYECLLQASKNWSSDHAEDLENKRLRALTNIAISNHRKWFDGHTECTGEYININGPKYTEAAFAVTTFGLLPASIIAATYIIDAFGQNALLSPIAKIFVTIAILMTLAIAFLRQKYRETVKKSLDEKASEITRELLKWYEIPHKQPAAGQMRKIIFQALKAAEKADWDPAAAIATAEEAIKAAAAAEDAPAATNTSAAEKGLDNRMWRKLMKEACATHDKWFNGVVENEGVKVNIQKEAMFKLLRTSLWIFMILLALDVVFPIGQKDVLTAAAVLVIGAVVVALLIYFKTRPRRTS